MSSRQRAKRKWYIPVIILMTVLIAAALWLLYFPKQLFFFLRSDQIEYIEQAQQRGKELTFVQISDEASNEFVEYLHDIKFSTLLGPEAGTAAAGHAYPIRIVLKSGRVFGIHVMPSVLRISLFDPATSPDGKSLRIRLYFAYASDDTSQKAAHDLITLESKDFYYWE